MRRNKTNFLKKKVGRNAVFDRFRNARRIRRKCYDFYGRVSSRQHFSSRESSSDHQRTSEVCYARLEVCMLLSGDFGKNPPAKRAENSVGSVGLESSAHEEKNR